MVSLFIDGRTNRLKIDHGGDLNNCSLCPAAIFHIPGEKKSMKVKALNKICTKPLPTVDG